MSSIFKKFKPEQTPSRYIFVDPDTNRGFQENSKTELTHIVRQYRTNNKLEPIKNLSMVIDNYLCGLPENQGKCVPYVLRRNLLAYLRGGIAILKDLLYGAEARVNQATAEERATQCSDCKFNVFADKTEVIRFADEMVETYLGSETATSKDNLLGNCDVCSCPLRFKVHVKGPFDIQNDELPLFKEVNCWQLKDHK